MCGIVGYIGNKRPLSVAVDGLRRLEYRGYDSAGIAYYNGKASCIKARGRIAELEKLVHVDLRAPLMIGHTRWATHGNPSKRNAHPHGDCTRDVYVVHNGIIENYRELKAQLIRRKHRFVSDTDSEVIAHLIEDALKRSANDTEEAFRIALQSIRGAYAIVMFSACEPDKLFAARNSSPLITGIVHNGSGIPEYHISSDASTIIPFTKHVFYLNDGEYGVFGPAGHHFATHSARRLKKGSSYIDWAAEQSRKDGYRHYMLKEINIIPDTLENAMRGRVVADDGNVKLGGIESIAKRLARTKRLVITACGTAYYAASVGEYMLEEYAGMPVEVDHASELRYRKAVHEPHTSLLTVSQSGETADTIAALREAKRKSLLTFGITNTVGSSIARETDAGIYNHAGPEIGVASTKAFVSQLAVFALLTVFLGRQRDMSYSMGKRITQELLNIPRLTRQVLASMRSMRSRVKRYAGVRNFLYLGRKYNYPIALEGALKLKEVSYIHAEGYGAGEMKHGPLALIDKHFPTVAIVPKDSVYEKTVSNLEEVKARGGPIMAIATEGDTKIRRVADDVFYIPKTLEMLTPMLSVIPLYLFAYYMALARGKDPDKPRNLAKSVTVE